MNIEFNKDFCLEMFELLLDVDSTTGMYESVQDTVCSMLIMLQVPTARFTRAAL